MEGEGRDGRERIGQREIKIGSREGEGERRAGGREKERDGGKEVEERAGEMEIGRAHV